MRSECDSHRNSLIWGLILLDRFIAQPAVCALIELTLGAERVDMVSAMPLVVKSGQWQKT